MACCILEIYLKKFEDEIRSIELKDSNFDKIIINNIIIRLERETNELKENVKAKILFYKEKYGFMWNYKSLEDKIYDLKSRLSNLDKYELKEKVISIYEDFILFDFLHKETMEN